MRNCNTAFWVTVLLFWPLAAAAQGQCDDRDKVLRLLANQYQETPVALGVTNDGALVEVLTDPEGKTWTIIITDHHGTSCLITSGQGWRSFKAQHLET